MKSIQMLDQSFSAENFRKILASENRRGKYLESISFFHGKDIFKESREVSVKIIEKNKEIREIRREIRCLKNKKNAEPQNELSKKKETLEKEKKELEKQRESKLIETFEELSGTANAKAFRVEIKKGGLKHEKKSLYFSGYS